MRYRIYRGVLIVSTAFFVIVALGLVLVFVPMAAAASDPFAAGVGGVTAICSALLALYASEAYWKARP